MSYRDRPDGYDLRRWSDATLRKRERRRGTRWLLLFGIALVALWPILRIAEGDPDGRTMPNIGLLLPLIIGASLSPFARESWLSARGRAIYDEFERGAYARATAIAYVAFLALVAVAAGYLWAASAFAWPHPHGARDWFAAGMALVLIGAALPLTMAEFIVPMPPLGDEFE